MQMITTKKECEAGAVDLGLLDTSAYKYQTENRPHGCIYQSFDDWLGWGNVAGDGQECGTNRYACICAQGKMSPVY